jgi:hypothetical protein
LASLAFLIASSRFKTPINFPSESITLREGALIEKSVRQ